MEEEDEEEEEEEEEPTCVVQDAILDDMGSDFRCQNEVMST